MGPRAGAHHEKTKKWRDDCGGGGARRGARRQSHHAQAPRPHSPALQDQKEEGNW